jgi:adenylate kinase family enzyme
VRRVVVIGTSCSGKTTLARRISRALEVPHVELDALNWGPNWSERPTEDLRQEVRERVSRAGWVVDGNYSKVQDIVWPLATDVVWLNYHFLPVFVRAVRRTLRRVLAHEELFGGCRESVRSTFFSRDSILWWVITSHRRRRRQYERLFDEGTFPQVRLTELRRPSEAETLARRLESAGRADV